MIPTTSSFAAPKLGSQDVDKRRDPLKFNNNRLTLHFYAATHRESCAKKRGPR